MAYRYDMTEMAGRVSDYGEPIQIIKVDRTKWEELWDELVKSHHYLGYNKTVGPRVKYLVMLEKRIVAAISYNQAVIKLAPRDTYLGWEQKKVREMLVHMVQNDRFLILPYVHIKNLASQILSRSMTQLRRDWKKQYGYEPYIVETFVDSERYRGSCYIASNWIHLGQTQGFGKKGDQYIYHGDRKEIFLYILNRRIAKSIRPVPPGISRREELLQMLMTYAYWFPGILNESGITLEMLDGIHERLIDHMEPYFKYLKRPETEENVLIMVKGLLSDLPRKSIEPIALAFKGESGVRAMQSCMSSAVWDIDGMIRAYRKDLAPLISDEDGMLVMDGTDFPKKGNDSAGVHRQYCGNRGKTENCQASVMVSYSSSRGYGLLDRELYLPKNWFTDEYKGRWKKCGIPDDREFKTKNQLALEMINRVQGEGDFPFKWVGMDCSFGTDKVLLDSLPENICYFADIRDTAVVFEVRPEMYIKQYSGHGRVPFKEHPAVKPVPVSSFAEDNEKWPWNEVVLGEGAKGPFFAYDKIIRVVEVRKNDPGKDIWLYIRKLDNGDTKFSISNAPEDTPFEILRKRSLMRWPIEQCFLECKDYLGMDHNESRSWNGWYRHILLTFIAHLFLTKLRLAFSAVPPADSLPRLVRPVELTDYIDNYHRPYESRMFADLRKPVSFLSIGMIRDIVAESLAKVGRILTNVNYHLKNYSDSYISYHNKRVANKLSS